MEFEVFSGLLKMLILKQVKLTLQPSFPRMSWDEHLLYSFLVCEKYDSNICKIQVPFLLKYKCIPALLCTSNVGLKKDLEKNSL